MRKLPKIPIGQYKAMLKNKWPMERYKAILMEQWPKERYQALKNRMVSPSEIIGREFTLPEKIRLLAAAFLMVLILFLLISDTNPFIDNPIASGITATSQTYLDTIQVSAGAAFLVARSLNAIISIFQSVNLEAGIGVSGSVSLGEVLDPINDLIERFSWVMLAVTVAISIQMFLMEIGLSLDFTGLVVCMLFLLLLWVLAQLTISLPVNLDEKTCLWQWLHRFLTMVSSEARTRIFVNFPLIVIAAVLVIHLLIPSVGYLNAHISGSLIDGQRNEAIASIERAKEKISDASDRLIDGLDPIENSVEDMKKNYAQAERIVSDETENIIKRSVELMAIFIIETMILPILFFWLLCKIIVKAISATFADAR